MVWVHIQAAHCTACSRHWKQAQNLRSRSSKGRSKQDKEKDADREKRQQNKKKEEGDPFSNVPWVNLTPRSRVPPVEELAEEAQLSPQPVLPPQPPRPESTGSQEENADLQMQVEALRKAMAGKSNVSKELQAAMETLAKEAGMEVEKPLSHSQLNQLTKTQKQIKGLKTKIEHLHGERKKFVTAVQTRFQEHSGLYVQQRKEMIDQMREKHGVLAKIREEIQASSQHVAQDELGQIDLPETITLQGFEQMYPKPELDVMDEDMENAELLADKPKKPVAGAFRRGMGLSAASPTKVRPTISKADPAQQTPEEQGVARCRRARDL